MERENNVRIFTDLDAWKRGHEVVMKVYELTRKFPTDERFGLANQMRRCAVSITSNIAEGFARKGKAEKIHFYFIAQGSTTELQNQLIIAKDLRYITSTEFFEMWDKTVEVQKLVNGLIRSTRGPTSDS